MLRTAAAAAADGCRCCYRCRHWPANSPLSFPRSTGTRRLGPLRHQGDRAAQMRREGGAGRGRANGPPTVNPSATGDRGGRGGRERTASPPSARSRAVRAAPRPRAGGVPTRDPAGTCAARHPRPCAGGYVCHSMAAKGCRRSVAHQQRAPPFDGRAEPPPSRRSHGGVEEKQWRRQARH